MLKPEDFFDLSAHPFASLFADTTYVWDALAKLKTYIREHLEGNIAGIRKGEALLTRTAVLYKGEVLEEGFFIDTAGKKPLVRRGDPAEGEILEGASIIYAGASLMDDDIFIGEDTVVEPGALIKGPTIIGDQTEVRQGAYIRGEALIGDGCVVGHNTEVKSSALLGGSKAGHFAYIGDSILGRVNLGAGTKLANLKIAGSPIFLHINGEKYETGLRKFGAILGDGVETGCNSVISPGCLLGPHVLVYPNVTARGYCPPRKIIKVNQDQKVENINT